jgi:hypothetical protein
MAKSKLKNEIAHAQMRFSERFGKTLPLSTYKGLCNRIRRGRAEYLGHQSNRISCWNMDYDGCRFTAVYDTERHVIVTFLYLRGSSNQ